MPKRENEPDTPSHETPDPVRYAVVGLGWFAQAAGLPGLENASDNSTIAALVSSDPEKLSVLGERYGVPEEHRVDYDGYDDLLESGAVDAVYIALPNHLHRDYAVRAARAGVHVLCEKPMALDEEECLEMIRAAEENGVKLMIAYRLHFEEMNLSAVEAVQSGRLGEPRIFEALFSNPMRNPEDVRLGPIEKGGGTVYDIGIYCINAARYLFRCEPEEVSAFAASGSDPRFAECDEMTTAILRFPGDRLASFTCSFGASSRNGYRVIGTEGDLLAEPGFDFKEDLKLRVTVDGETSEEEFPKRDQIAPEFHYFSRCILEDEDPEPDGYEGLADIRVVRAIHESARRGGAPVAVEPTGIDRYPSLEMEQRFPAPGKQDLMDEEPP